MSSQDPAGWSAWNRSGVPAPPPRHAGVHDLGDVMLASGPGMPRVARAIVSDWLDGRTSADVLSDAQLLISELVTNSFVHAGDTRAPVRLRAGTSGGSVWFEVGDAGRGGAIEQRAPAEDGTGGYGLQLVGCLASEWGVTHVNGTEVWFFLARRGAKPRRPS